jgi:hypothetical protein
MNMRDERHSRSRTTLRLRTATRTLAALFALAILLEAATLTVTGSWTVSIGQANLSGAAGSDLTSTYASSTSAATMGVSAFLQNWRIDVYRQDTTWNAALHIWVKRTNNGTSGTGTYSGGTTFLDLTTTSQTWMTGSGSRSGFTLQFQLTGVSCAVPAASNSTTIVYTIVQI